MFSKDIRFGNNAKTKLLKGINLVGDAVGCTLGPKGNCVIIGDIDRKPIITKDGVTVAKYVETKDLTEDAGVKLIREAATKMLSDVGDATTTSTVIAQAMINESSKYLKIFHPIQLKEEIQKLSRDVLEEFKNYILPIKDGDILNIATISANNDYEIGKLIAEAFNQIGRDGIINVEESQNSNTSIRVIEGMQFENGYLAPHFVTDSNKDLCILENPYILITDQKIDRIDDIMFILSNVFAERKSILLIAEDYDEEVIETLKLNKIEKGLKCCAIKAPAFGEYRKSVLDDIAVLTQGFNISYDSNLNISDTKLSYLGTCSKVIVSKKDTTIIGGKGDVKSRITDIKAELDREKSTPELQSDFKIKFLEERIAKLSSGICTIFVGGTTELELKEKKDRVEDAVCATKAAIEEGIVCGGGLVFYNLYRKFKDDSSVSKEAKNIILSGLIAPFNKIVENAGLNPKKLYKHLTNQIGYDASTGEFSSLLEVGIIDPAKAERLAFENAISVTSLFLTTYCTIVPEIVINGTNI